MNGRGTTSYAALGWAQPGFQLRAGAEELAKTEDRQQEWIQLELQAWPLVETGSEEEGASFS